MHPWFYAFVKSMSGYVEHSGKEGCFMKGKNNIWKRWSLGSAYFSPVLTLYRNPPIDLLYISVDLFLYNGNTGLNCRVDAWLRWILIFRYTFWFLLETPFFISASVAQRKIMIYVSKMLSIIFKFSMISAQYLPLKAVFYRFYDVICRHCASIFVLKHC